MILEVRYILCRRSVIFAVGVDVTLVSGAHHVRPVVTDVLLPLLLLLL